MSCSKLGSEPHFYMRPAGVRDLTASYLESFSSHLHHEYKRTQEIFSYDGKVYALLSWSSFNKDSVYRMVTATLWRFKCTYDDVLAKFTARVVDDLIQHPIINQQMPNREYMAFIKSPMLIKCLLEEVDMEQVVHGFSTNDILAFDSFTFTGKYSPKDKISCVERSVMCIAKSRFNEVATKAASGEALKHIALTSKFVQPNALRAILKREDNDERFDDKVPSGLQAHEHTEWKFRELVALREELKAMDPDFFKKLYLDWLNHNYELHPRSSPAKFKTVGRSLLMDAKGVEEWDKMAGLLFLLATSKVMNNAVNLHFVLPIEPTTFIAEITPNDAKYGVKPPDDQRLDYVTTPMGKVWFIGLIESHGAPQAEFVAKLTEALRLETDEGDLAAFEMLTEGLRSYKHGILGLVKRIYVDIIHGRMKLTPGVNALISKALDPYKVERDSSGLAMCSPSQLSKELDWYFHYPHVRMSTDYREPYEFYSRIGMP